MQHLTNFARFSTGGKMKMYGVYQFKFFAAEN